MNRQDARIVKKRSGERMRVCANGGEPSQSRRYTADFNRRSRRFAQNSCIAIEESEAAVLRFLAESIED